MVSRIFSYKYELILVVLTSILLFSGLNKIEVNIMEARNFTTAREMVQNKEYLLTTLNGEPRYQKPPLPTWLTAISGSLLGFDSLFTLRLPVVLITFLLVFTLYFLSKRMGLTPVNSFNNSLILITSFYIFFAGRDNQWDMYTHSFMLVSIFFLWKLLRENKNQTTNSLLSGLFLGFSILSKGPVSLYALFLPFIISYIVVYKIPFKEKWKYLLLMLISGLAIGLSWFAYVRLNDPEYFRLIATREAANWRNYEVKPFYYYWNFFIQSGLWTIPALIALIYPYLKTKVTNIKEYKFSLIWTVSSVILLSLIPEKKVRYLVPTLIPMALTTGFYINYLINNFGRSTTKRENIVVYISFGIIALIGIAYPFAMLFVLKELVVDYLFIYITSSILLLVCTYIIATGLVQKEFGKILYTSIAVFTIAVVSILPISTKLFTNPNYATTTKVQELEKRKGIKTYSLSDIAPEIVWNFGKQIPRLNSEQYPSENSFGLLLDASDSSKLRTFFPNYTTKKLYRINMHYRKSKKTRLIKDYYLIEKDD